jgi:SAM-dependent methyltransferase
VSNLIPRLEFGLQALVRRQRICPFCKTQNHAVVARKRGVVRIRRCASCGLYFTDPIYKSLLADLYGSLYRAEGSTTTVPDEPALRTLKATRFGASDKNCALQILALQRLGAGRRLLEIGSSWGYFLYQAEAAGFAAIGVEPGRLRREYGVRELGVDIRGSIDQVPETGFDLVYCAHTLEHITDVGQFFADCHARLRAGGLLVIEVPHFDLQAFGRRVLPIIGAVHPIGLSQPFFHAALPRAGFRCVGIFNEWTAVPSSPVTSAREGNLLVIAEKAARTADGCPPQ